MSKKNKKKNKEIINDNINNQTNENINNNDNLQNDNELRFMKKYVKEPIHTEDDKQTEKKLNNEENNLNEQEISNESINNEDNTSQHTDDSNIVKNKSQNRYYFGYYSRLIILSIILILSLILATVFAFNIFDISKEDYINYSEKSNIDYKVYLKENNFYDTDFLIKDRVYVASLIDHINIDFNYKFASDKNVNALFKYNINAKLLITDINNENIYYEKEYEILPEKEISLNSKNSKNIIETININYDQYNKIANKFKNSYALNTKNKLIIYFNIDKNFVDSGKTIKNDKNKISLEIPLSEKSVEIKLNTNEINNDNKILLSKNSNYKINWLFVILFLLVTIVFITVLLKLIKYVKCLTVSDNCYDNYINKLLNEYDRLIVKTNTPPFKTEDDRKNIVQVDNFEELLDVRDNVKKPIMYYVITKHVKCQFYIKNEGNIYITTIKKIDLEAENETK